MTDRSAPSIVIVNWNSGPYLENCVRSLLLHAPTAQIIIVDNASKDSSMRFAGEFQDRLRVFLNEQNIGFAAANNIGWHASEGNRVLFLNPDTECYPGAVACLEKTMDSDDAIWAAGGQLVGPAGKAQRGFNIRMLPTLGSVAAEMLCIDEIWPSNPWTGPNRLPGSTCEIDVEQPAAACLMVSRCALESTGGFDEAFYPAWFEDVDLCRRIRTLGGRIRYQPEARFLHYGGYSLDQMSRQNFLESFHRNQIRYFRKHHGIQASVRVKRWIVLGLVTRSIVSVAYPLAPGQSRGVSAGIFWKAARAISGMNEDAL
jgi:N-acetylglucosaminyl-diphospho-decaprenol L-rhamnosyltransferase